MTQLIKEKIQKKNIYIMYTVLFLAFYFLIFSPFLVYGKAYLWSSDGMSQHYPSLIYTREWLYSILQNLIQNHKIEIPFWELSLGFGQDVFGNAINFRLFNFLYVFWESLSIENYLVFRSIGSLYLCGLGFIWFAKTKSQNNYAVLLGSLTYVFSGFSLYFAARHPFFLEMMFYFPLILIGVDSIFKKKKSAIFVLTVFLSGISYFYFLYMITLPAIIYALFRYFELYTKKERNIKEFFIIILHFAWQYLLGVLLAGFSLLPSLVRLINSSRTSVETGLNYLFWDLSHYKDFFAGIFDMQQIGIYGFISFSGIVFLSILYMIFSYDVREKIYLGQFIIYTATFLIPVFTLLFSGFAGRTQRWCYIYAFWTSMIFVKMLPLVLEKNKKIFVRSCIGTGLYLIIYLIINWTNDQTFSSGIVWLLFYIILLVIVNMTDFLVNRKYVAYIVIGGMLCIEITMKSYDLYSTEGANYIAEFADAGTVIAAGNNNASSVLRLNEDDSLYRVDVVSAPLSQKYNQMNYGLRNYVNGVSSYYSFSDQRICDYSLKLGNSQQNVKFLILDFDQRTALNTLAGVKYVATTDSSNTRVPYGYELIASDEKTYSDGTNETEYLYQNSYTLPLMYCYDSYITSEEYETLDTNEKEQAMLQGIVLEENINYPKTKLDFDYLTLLDMDDILDQLSAISQNDDSIEISEEGLLVKDNNVSITLNIPSGITGELYVMMNNVKYRSINPIEIELKEQAELLTRYEMRVLEQENNNWTANSGSTVNANMEDKSDTGTLLNNTNQYYLGERDLLLNLGYTQTADTLTITFSGAGEYTFDELEVVSQPMDSYVEYVSRLQTTPVQNITIDNNQIKGEIYCTEDKIVCIAVPYSKGWKAEVNGKETDLYPANGMYMAVKISEGNNEIALTYTTPGFYIGCLLSGISLIACTVILIVPFVQKRKHSR